jgi:uncharacterized protein YggE
VSLFSQQQLKEVRVVVSPQLLVRSRTVIAFVLLALMSLGVPAHSLAQSSLPAPVITVVGYGESTAPAETAQIQMIVAQEEYGPPRAPNPNATPGEEERLAVEPVVESLQAAGIAAESIDVIVGPAISTFYGPGGRGIARVDLQVDVPTSERIVELIDAATVGAAQNSQVLSLIGVGFGISDCATLEREARAAALADAWSRAEMQAELMGLSLGQPIASSDIPPAQSSDFNAYYGLYTAAQTACSPAAHTPTGGSPVTLPAFDPTSAAEAHVYAQVSVTFAAEEVGAATPEA